MSLKKSLEDLAKKLLSKKVETATLEEAEAFFRKYGDRDINTLGLTGISPDIPIDSPDYTRRFENLNAAFHRSVAGPSIQVTAEYNCVYEGENREEEGSQMFRQTIEHQHIEYIVPLLLEAQEEK